MGRHAANRPAPVSGGAPAQRAPMHADLFAPNPGSAAARAAEQRTTQLFESLVAPHRAGLRAYVLRLTNGDEAGADSVVKETLYRAAQDPARYPQTDSAVRPWLVLTARTVLRDASLREGSLREGPLRDAPLRDASFRDASHRDGPRSDGPLRDGPRDTERRDVEMPAPAPARRSTTVLRALDDLSDVHRDILVELFYRGSSLEDAADDHGVSVAAVKAQLYYAMRALRVVLDQQVGGPGPDLSAAP
jgi:RNA polymerase sigma-70 factor (ECF subfamily)